MKAPHSPLLLFVSPIAVDFLVSVSGEIFVGSSL